MRFQGFPLRIQQTIALLFGISPMAAVILPAYTQESLGGENPLRAGTVLVKVGLVQTDVTVLDKQGRFVPDLKMRQFAVRLDGKVQPIEFFGMVSAGSAHDRGIWMNAEGNPVVEPALPAPDISPPGRILLILLYGGT